MRKRDLGILLLAAFAVFLSLQHDGDFSFREVWYHLSDQDYPIKYEADHLPPPLVADLNGNGKPEILLPTVDCSYKHTNVRKQVLVVVTSGWTVMCFDHNLKKLWEANLQDDFPHGAHHREVAISVTNYTLKHGEQRLVPKNSSPPPSAWPNTTPDDDQIQRHLSTDPLLMLLLRARPQC